MRNQTRKITIISLFVAIGLVLQYIEGQIYITPTPGGKIGLCNIVSILNIFLFGGANAVFVAFVRSLLGALLFGGVTTALYSVLGATVSTLAMWGIKRFFYPKVSIVGMSVTGAVCHNISQLFLAMIFYKSPYVFSYLPTLLVFASASGLLTGAAAHVFVKTSLIKELKQ